jgi:hypothetical protein
MPRRHIVTVSPAKEGWKAGSRRFENKEAALSAAKREAKSAALGQVRVQGRDGRLQTEHTYGKDPRAIKG